MRAIVEWGVLDAVGLPAPVGSILIMVFVIVVNRWEDLVLFFEIHFLVTRVLGHFASVAVFGDFWIFELERNLYSTVFN